MFAYILTLLQHVLPFALRIEKSSFPRPLSKEEERDCFEKIKNNDELARQILIKHNLRLVAYIVKKYYSASNDQDDLISIGIIGLIKAVKSYDFEKKIKFATYASRCIENEILMYFRQIKKNINSSYAYEDVDFLNGSKSCCSSYELAEDRDILDIVDLRYKTQDLYHFVNKFLTDYERKVLIYRYGLYNKIPLTQQETSKRLNISRSYVSRIEKRAIEKLTKEFRKKY